MDAPAAAEWPTEGAISSRAAFQAAVRGVLAHAAERGVRRMHWISPDFDNWPLDEPWLLDALSDWARPRTVQLTWLASDFEALRRRTPRLVAWRQRWSHVLQCLGPDDGASAELPSLLVADDKLLIKVMDPARWRGRISCSAADIQAAREQIDALLQRSSDTFPVTTLGI
jgi:hypothetical protein